MSENIFKFSPRAEYFLCPLWKKILLMFIVVLGTIKKSVSPVCYTPEPINNMTQFCRFARLQITSRPKKNHRIWFQKIAFYDEKVSRKSTSSQLDRVSLNYLIWICVPTSLSLVFSSFIYKFINFVFLQKRLETWNFFAQPLNFLSFAGENTHDSHQPKIIIYNLFWQLLKLPFSLFQAEIGAIESMLSDILIYFNASSAQGENFVFPPSRPSLMFSCLLVSWCKSGEEKQSLFQCFREKLSAEIDWLNEFVNIFGRRC